MIKDQMDNIYRTLPVAEIPWNIETPPRLLRQPVESGLIKPCRVIDLGCGTGNYAIYMARAGFDVTGVDISEAAIEIGDKAARDQGVDCTFIATDLLGPMSAVNGRFRFAYDWELLHHIFPEDRSRYVRNVHRLLEPGGRYMSVCFSEDDPGFGGKGKYRKTPLETVLYFSCESELAVLFGRFFQVERLKTVDVEGKFGSHKAIHAMLIRE